MRYRSGRRLGIAACALVSIGLLASSVTSAAAVPPPPTRPHPVVHVDAIMDDMSLRFVPADVPAGPVEVRFLDRTIRSTGTEVYQFESASGAQGFPVTFSGSDGATQLIQATPGLNMVATAHPVSCPQCGHGAFINVWDDAKPLARGTHVDAIVDDVAPGLHFVPSTIPAGIVDITLLDRRAPEATGNVTLQSFNVNFPIDITNDCPHAGTCFNDDPWGPIDMWRHQATKVQQLGSYHIVAKIVGATDPPCCIGDAMLTVVAPVLAPPGEPVHEVHVSVKNALVGHLQPKYLINTPYRESRLREPIVGQPLVHFVNRVWTSVSVGTTKITVTNTSSDRQKCTIAGFSGAWSVAKNHSVSRSVKLTGPVSTNRYVLSCAGNGATTDLALWLVP